MRWLDKEASVQARAIEAVVGLGAGAAGAGFLGGKTFQTKKPRHWLSDGQVYSRDLTKSEKKDFLKRVAQTAAAGAAAGLGVSMGGSVIRRKMLEKVDLREAQRLFRGYFGSLNRAVTVSERIKPRANPNYEEATDLLRSYRDSMNPGVFMDRARRYRTDAPWGGPSTTKIRMPGPTVYEPDGTLTRTVQDSTIPGPATAHGQMLRELGIENVDLGVDSRGRTVGQLREGIIPHDRIGEESSGLISLFGKRIPGRKVVVPGFWNEKVTHGR
jgi:hypothetical protein